jgi:hypothetical protein
MKGIFVTKCQTTALVISQFSTETSVKIVPYPTEVMVRILVLKRLYNLSGP